MSIAFFAHGIPKGQPRPRAFSRGGKARVFDPGTAEGWKGQIAIAAKGCLPAQPITGPIALAINFYFPRPGRLKTKKAMAIKDISHTAKPDADNLAKAVMDALTELGMWTDDALVCDLAITKSYEDDARAGAYIRIRELQIV
jgi:Holliday junction resolvase RusA-like endonuclease